MSTENQNRENQNEKVDYQDLFNSLVKENEQKEPMAEKAKSKMKRKQKSSRKTSAFCFTVSTGIE